MGDFGDGDSSKDGEASARDGLGGLLALVILESFLVFLSPFFLSVLLSFFLASFFLLSALFGFLALVLLEGLPRLDVSARSGDQRPV